MTKLMQKIDKQMNTLQDKIEALNGNYLTNTWKRQREQQERDRKKDTLRSQLQVMGHLKQKAETDTLTLLDRNLTVAVFYEDMRGLSASKEYCDNNPYIDFQYPKADDVRVKRLQKAGVTNTAELIAAVEEYDKLIQSATTPPDQNAVRLRDMIFKAQMYQKGGYSVYPF